MSTEWQKGNMDPNAHFPFFFEDLSDTQGLYSLQFKLGKVIMISNFIDQLSWAKKGFPLPAPGWAKWGCLIKHGFKDATWIESGTFVGETTNFLSKTAKRVVSIEPEPELFRKAKQRFAGVNNVEIIKGLSEEVFPSLLPTIGGRVNFWLDGHYSAGFTHLGPQETPIVDELQAIADNMQNFEGVCVLVDDVRLFGNTVSDRNDPAYPDIDVLVNWSRDNNLAWTIEQDIFIMKTVL